MKNIESDALLEYSADQLYEVIDDCGSYDLTTVVFVFGICKVDGFDINMNRISLLNQRVSETEFNSFQDYVNDLVNKKGAKDIAEYLDIVPEGHEDHVPQDESVTTPKIPYKAGLKILASVSISFIVTFFLLYSFGMSKDLQSNMYDIYGIQPGLFSEYSDWDMYNLVNCKTDAGVRAVMEGSPFKVTFNILFHSLTIWTFPKFPLVYFFGSMWVCIRLFFRVR